MKITNLLNSFFNTDKLELRSVCNKYNIILIILFALFTILALIFKKDNYYENYIIDENNNIIIMVEKPNINMIKKNGKIIINGVSNNYNIIKVRVDGDNCLVYINLEIYMENINHQKYQILLGKETIIEYIIKIIL